MKKVLYVTGSRADYGLMRKVLAAMQQDEGIALSVAVTGMHLMPEYDSVREIEQDGLKVYNLHVVQRANDRQAMADFTAACISSLSSLCEELHPDLILLLGDRAEMMAGAIVGTYLGIAVAHIHGGEVSSTVDEQIRHAITKLSHVHFPATEDSASRLLKLGERQDRIFVVGAPGLEGITEDLLTRDELNSLLKIDGDGPLILIIFHPVSEELHESGQQMKTVLESCEGLEGEKVIIYPNADAGSGEIIYVIDQYRTQPHFKVFGNLSRQHYLSLMKYAALMIGNSSSGLIEAPSFHLPFIHVGSRQSGRLRGENVLDVPCKASKIKAAVDRALSGAFRQKLKNCSNPYGDGNTAARMIGIIKALELDSGIIQKQITY